jgi:hypothetical protein
LFFEKWCSVAIVVEGEENALVHFDIGQAFAWEFLKKKQRISVDDYEYALKLQREEEERIAEMRKNFRGQNYSQDEVIAKELEEEEENVHAHTPINFSQDEVIAKELEEEDKVHEHTPSDFVPHLEESDMADMAMSDSAIARMIDNGEFNVSVSGHEMETRVSITKPLPSVSEDMTISMQTQKWRSDADFRLAMIQKEKEEKQNTYDHEIAKKLEVS